MYIVLSGARKNLGDFLITERCKALLGRYRPNEKLVQFDAAEALDAHLDLVNKSSGIIIMGGPGYRPNMYPKIYRLCDDLGKIKVPIILMGLGWKGKYDDENILQRYRFSRDSLALLKFSSEKCRFLGCRDYFTWQVLRRHGLDNVLMTGCPAWYDLESIGKSYSPPDSLNNIAFSIPAQSEYSRQAIDIVRMLREKWPESTVTAFSHHGFSTKGQKRKADFFRNQREMKDALKKIGVACEDLSGSLEGIDRYREFDIHIGYRVHAHIYFLSRRRTSILVYEDGRGAGVDDALRIPGLRGWKVQCESAPQSIMDRIRGRTVSYRNFTINKKIPDELNNLLEREVSHGFASFSGIGEVLDGYLELMARFIDSI